MERLTLNLKKEVRRVLPTQLRNRWRTILNLNIYFILNVNIQILFNKKKKNS